MIRSGVQKRLFGLVVGVLAGIMISGCKGKDKKAEESAATTDMPADSAPAVESTPMSFEPGGSDTGKIDGLQTVHFSFDKSSLDSKAKEILKGNAEWMKKNSQAKLQIEGHCDNRGSIEYNLALGERRANAVKNYMVSLGVGSDRMDTISYGEEKPLMNDETESAWAKNRRANFVPMQ